MSDHDDDFDDELTVTSLRDDHAITGRRSMPERLLRESRGWQRAQAAFGSCWRMWYRLIGSIAVIAALLAGLFVWLQPSLANLLRPPKPPAPLTFSVGEFHCVDDVVWSPDSSRLAVLSETGCDSLSGTAPKLQQAVLTLYDAHTGHTLASVALNTVVAKHVSFPLSEAGKGQIFYNQLLWLPDGRHILVSFNAIVPPAGSGAVQQVANGLVIVPVAPISTTGIRVLFGPAALSSGPNPGPANPAGPFSYERWDLTTGTVDTIQTQLALVYRWTRSDELSPISPVASWTSLATLPKGIVGGAAGNPLGGIQFSLWQNGYIQYDSANGCSSPQGLGQYSSRDIYEIDMVTPTISPDGRYLIPAVYAQGRLPVRPPQPKPTPAGSTPLPPTDYGCIAATGAKQFPQLPVRDAGLRAALSLVTMNTQPSIQVAWRADGARLAVAPAVITSGAPALTIYDCATGAVRARFSITQLDALADTSQSGGSPFQILRWSPDGTHLLALPQGPGAQAILFAAANIGG